MYGGRGHDVSVAEIHRLLAKPIAYPPPDRQEREHGAERKTFFRAVNADASAAPGYSGLEVTVLAQIAWHRKPCPYGSHARR